MAIIDSTYQTLVAGSGSNDTIYSDNFFTNTLIGGAGSDTYFVQGDQTGISYSWIYDEILGDMVQVETPFFVNADVVVETGGTAGGVDTVVANSSYSLSANVENLTGFGYNQNFVGNNENNVIKSGGNYYEDYNYQYASSNSLYGNGGADTLIGDYGNNVLDGGTGVDRMVGGLGNDTYYVDNAADVIVEKATTYGVSFYYNEGYDQVFSTASYSLSANVENLTLQGTAVSGTGNALSNTIFGNEANNTLTGLGGIDFLYGGGGNDRLDGGDGDDFVGDGYYSYEDGIYHVGGGNDVLLGGAGNDNLNSSGGGNDVLSGGDGNDYIYDDGGNDNISGGNGDDYIRSGGGVDAISGGAGNDEIYKYNDGTGAGQVNVISGGDGNDYIEVEGYGATSIDGGIGNDQIDVSGIYSYTEYGSVVVTGGEGDDDFYINGNIDASPTYDTGLGLKLSDVLGNDTVHLVGENYNSYLYALGGGIENLDASGLYSSAGLLLRGNAADNLVIGTGAGDIIEGGAGNDTLDGRGGDDNLIGGAGNDTFIVSDYNDSVVELAAGGTDTVISAVTHHQLEVNVENLTLMAGAINGAGNALNNIIIGNSANNVLDGDAGDDVVKGNEGNDTLVGRSGNDTLDGGTGNDVLWGGLGNDVFYVDSSSDAVKELIDEGTDKVISTASSYTLSANVETLQLAGTANISGFGNGAASTIIGNSGNNTLGDNGGTDTLTGGLGNDTYQVTFSGTTAGQDKVVELLDQGTDSVQLTLASSWAGASKISLNTTFANVENLTVTTSLTSLTGGGLVQIEGSAANNVIAFNGAVGASVAAGLGNDTVYGGSGNDILDGGDGNNYLSGGAGNDALKGGLGNDTYSIGSDTGDTVVDTGGIDTVVAENQSINLTTFAGGAVENATVLNVAENGGVTLTGNAAANVLSITDTTVYGSIYSLAGQAGNDNYVLSIGDKNFSITESSTLAAGGFDTLTVYDRSYTSLDAGVEKLVLGNGSYYGAGNSAANTIVGNSLDNTLDGGAGADVMVGGAGSDTYYVDNAADAVTEAAGNEWDLVYLTKGISYVMGANVEEGVIQNGVANATLIGNALDNQLYGRDMAATLYGGAGNDGLWGAAGNDMLYGGTGDDQYHIADGDKVFEVAGEGYDTVFLGEYFTGSSYSLAANVENLEYYSGTNMVLTGNGLANIINSGYGNDTIDGGAGADTMIGGYGNDTYKVDNAGDLIADDYDFDTVLSSVSFNLASNGAGVESLTLVEGSAAINGIGNALDNTLLGNSGNNFLQGLGGNDSLVGGAGTDTLEGGAGNDVLDGGTGNDVMVGGAGNDIYYVDNTGDVVTELSGEGTDTVYSSVNFTVTKATENLILTGSGDIDGASSAASANNMIVGNAGANTLDGGGGNDLLSGDEGNDVLNGGTGTDNLTGGAGDDVFEFDVAGAENADVVTDFADGSDTISLSTTYFTGVADNGADVATSAGGVWGSVDIHVLYNSTTGALSYSELGGGDDAVLIATLGTGLDITNADVVLI